MRASTIPAWLSVTILALMLGLIWIAVYVSGGSQRALPHLFYIPIVLASLPFGWWGSTSVAVVAAILCGPLMPLSTATGESQQAGSWLLRGVMFAMVGTLAALAVTIRAHLDERQLQDDLRVTLARSTASHRHVDRSAVHLVGDVVERQAFHPVFQPIYCLRTGRLLSVEALTRFDTVPYRTPDIWFAAAAEAGLGTELEIAAIQAALDAEAADGGHLDVSVNASPATLADPRLLELARSSPNRSLTVEITEHAAIEDYRVLKEHLEPLRAVGVRIAVDDAGAGFASLQHILQLAPDIIKLDISLTQGVESSPLRRALAGSLIEFADQTGAQLVVEGIERKGDLAVWSALGAHAVQGYLIGRPGNLPVAPASPLIDLMNAAR